MAKYDVYVVPTINVDFVQEVEAKNEKEAIAIVRKMARKEVQRRLVRMARSQSNQICNATFSAAPARLDEEGPRPAPDWGKEERSLI
jgi:hypothetical protein